MNMPTHIVANPIQIVAGTESVAWVSAVATISVTSCLGVVLGYSFSGISRSPKRQRAVVTRRGRSRAYCLTNPAQKRVAAKEFSIKARPDLPSARFLEFKREIRTSFAASSGLFLRDQRPVVGGLICKPSLIC
jgi:hypothetical protein